MARREDGKRMTLSEHLALRAKAAEEAQAREEELERRVRSLKALDAEVMCTCPACVRLRQMRMDASNRSD